MAFEREVAAFRRELPRLLEQGERGRFALVYGDEVISVWDTRGDAIQAGWMRFGLVPILVQEVQSEEKPIFIPFLQVPQCR